MLKLITLNIEMDKHYARFFPFLDKENADVICLQEVPESALLYFHERGFTTIFAPMIIKKLSSIEEKVGIALATKLPFSVRKVYYHGTEENLVLADGKDPGKNSAYAYIMAKIDFNGEVYSIATTHMVDTPNGKENDLQILVMNKMLKCLKQEEAHCLCGDFNMPRGYNNLYEKITSYYIDSIPKHFGSSLDGNLHRARKIKLDQPIFDIYMVDYIFTQAPYEAKVEKLQFGVSDHAGVVAHIQKTK